jgi:hypothetical protein
VSIITQGLYCLYEGHLLLQTQEEGQEEEVEHYLLYDACHYQEAGSEANSGL